MEFNGYRKESIQFLKDLKENNNKEWFTENKIVYQETILKDSIDFYTALSKVMLEIDINLDINTKQGKNISRIYRDVRFSKNKLPYRTNVWFSYYRKSNEWKENPGYFFDISDSEITYGMGFYTAKRDTMDNFRAYLEDNVEEFKNIIKIIDKETNLQVMGDNYKRIVFPKDFPEELKNWYSKKSVYLFHTRRLDESIYTSDIFNEVKSAFTAIKDIYNLFLNFSK